MWVICGDANLNKPFRITGLNYILRYYAIAMAAILILQIIYQLWNLRLVLFYLIPGHLIALLDERITHKFLR